MAKNILIVLLLIISLHLSKANYTDILEKSLNQIKDEFNYKLNTSIKVQEIYEKRMEDIMKQYSELREDLNSKTRDKSISNRINQNWVNYREEKNFLLIKKLVQQKNAEEICKALEDSTDSTVTLATIESKDEQNFINKYLYEDLGIVENVWIGVTKDELKNEFIISNKNYVKFTNWTNGSPSYSSDKKCIQLVSPFKSIKDVLNGFWEDVSCDYNNWVLCQRTPDWTLARVRREFFEMKSEITIRINNMIPIGFIYSQLPSQPEPQIIWPNFNWTDISSQYFGLFFRVYGNNSLNSSEIQDENSPRLIGVTFDSNSKLGQSEMLANGNWSLNVVTCHNGCSTSYYNHYQISSGEVRPRNQAIHIWKRV